MNRLFSEQLRTENLVSAVFNQEVKTRILLITRICNISNGRELLQTKQCKSTLTVREVRLTKEVGCDEGP